MPIDQAEFTRRVARLRDYTAGLLAVIDDTFPPGYVPPLGTPSFSADYPLKYLTGPIDGVLGSFDAVQEALGRPLEHTRHHKFLCPGPIVRK